MKVIKYHLLPDEVRQLTLSGELDQAVNKIREDLFAARQMRERIREKREIFLSAESAENEEEAFSLAANF